MKSTSKKSIFRPIREGDDVTDILVRCIIGIALIGALCILLFAGHAMYQSSNCRRIQRGIIMQIVVPQPSSLFPWGTAARKIYEALTTEGEVSNIRITRGLHLRYYADVIDQIREALWPLGLDVVRRRLAAGAWTYRIAVTDQNQKAA